MLVDFRLQKKFAKLVHEEENFSIFNRYPVQAVKEIFPQIKVRKFLFVIRFVSHSLHCLVLFL